DGRFDTQRGQVVPDRRGALIGQRQIVFLGAARIGVPDQHERAVGFPDAFGVALQRGRSLGCDGRFIEVEVHGIVRAGSSRRRPSHTGHAAATLAFLVLRAIVVLVALLGALAASRLALAAGTALIVRSAGLAGAVDAGLPRR